MASTPTVITSGTQATTVGSTPDTLYSTTNPGTYLLSLDCNALAADEVLYVAINRKVLTGGTVRSAYPWQIVGPVADPIQISLPVTCGFGADFTINQPAGTTRNIPFEVIAP